MENLQKEIQLNGYRTELKNDQLKVKLGGLTNSAHIKWDIALNRFRLSDKDTYLSITIAYLCGYGIYLLQTQSLFMGSLFISVAVIQLISLLISQIKSLPLRAIVESYNAKLKDQESQPS
ncbi:hypothetical protein TUM4261_40680 [Shewanella sp. c952]|uniref:hypothetical protein n=1 Tax=Shewanella sp. c952 TaxID=2815913 RepID=UPI001BBD0800|nr:hypothetical protein [Shewanella sp. c952]GIU19084.1 hypothetical protein TUM4261_40680 [Shewanella sp. c952]